MTGAVDVLPFPQFATGDACSRSTDPSLSKDTEGAHPLVLFVPSSSEDFTSASGAQDAPPGAPVSLQLSQSRVLEQYGATAASLRHAVGLGDCALGMLSKDIPEDVLDEVHTWRYAHMRRPSRTSSFLQTALVR